MKMNQAKRIGPWLLFQVYCGKKFYLAGCHPSHIDANNTVYCNCDETLPCAHIEFVKQYLSDLSIEEFEVISCGWEYNLQQTCQVFSEFYMRHGWNENYVSVVKDRPATSKRSATVLDKLPRRIKSPFSEIDL